MFLASIIIDVVVGLGPAPGPLKTYISSCSESPSEIRIALSTPFRVNFLNKGLSFICLNPAEIYHSPMQYLNPHFTSFSLLIFFVKDTMYLLFWQVLFKLSSSESFILSIFKSEALIFVLVELHI